LIKNNQAQRKLPKGIITAVLLILPLIAFLFLLLIYNFQFFGGWLNLPHNYRVTTLVSGLPTYHFGLAKVFSLNYLENGLYTLLLSPNRGILCYCPIFIFSIAGYALLAKRSSEIANLFLSLFLINLLAYSLFYDPWGGWSFGPRYLIISMPVMALLVGESFQYIKNKIFYLICFTLLFFASFAVALAGVLTTNMIPPFAEVGKQLTFTHAFSMLSQQQSRSFLFDLINNHLYVSGIDYYLLIFGLFLLIFLPNFIFQLILNIRSSFKNIRLHPIIIARRSQRVSLQK
jgi:hypothetical protein